MKPTAADTLKWMPVISKATNPPIIANGTFITISDALLSDWNAQNNRTKISTKLTGTINESRFIARC